VGEVRLGTGKGCPNQHEIRKKKRGTGGDHTNFITEIGRQKKTGEWKKFFASETINLNWAKGVRKKSGRGTHNWQG